MKLILYIACLIGAFGSFILPYLPYGSYYILVSSLIFLLCTHLFLSDKKSFVRYLLFALSINNLADELFFDPLKLQFNEIVFSAAVPMVWILKILWYDGKVKPD